MAMSVSSDTVTKRRHKLREDVAHHKRKMRYHRRKLRQASQELEEYEERLREHGVKLETGVEKGDSHGR